MVHRLDFASFVDERGRLLPMGPGCALFVDSGTWISLRDFQDDAVLLVLASEAYVGR